MVEKKFMLIINKEKLFVQELIQIIWDFVLFTNK